MLLLFEEIKKKRFLKSVEHSIEPNGTCLTNSKKLSNYVVKDLTFRPSVLTKSMCLHSENSYTSYPQHAILPFEGWQSGHPGYPLYYRLLKNGSLCNVIPGI